MFVCVSVCVSIVSDFSETVEVIIIKRVMGTASDMVRHDVFIILTWTFIRVTQILIMNKCSIISETK